MIMTVAWVCGVFIGIGIDICVSALSYNIFSGITLCWNTNANTITNKNVEKAAGEKDTTSHTVCTTWSLLAWIFQVVTKPQIKNTIIFGIICFYIVHAHSPFN
jgi:hypothetical protein